MMRIDKITILLFMGLLLGACSSSDDIGDDTTKLDKKIELSYAVPGYAVSTTNGTTSAKAATMINAADGTRATDAGSTAEQSVSNLYVFLFPTTGSQSLLKYYVGSPSTSDYTWSSTDKKVTINITQAVAGSRNVYIVANCSAAMKTALDGVTTVAGLANIMETTAQPWSPNLPAPMLMYGNTAGHNFATNSQLNSVALTRALAKIELNITLSTGFHVVPTTVTGGGLNEYRYRYVGFDKITYLQKPGTKPSNVVNSSDAVWPSVSTWTPWGNTLNATSDTGDGYTVNASGKVTGLKVITYINETDVAGSQIQISLPRVDSGPLPPPEFGPELYSLPLPKTITRNTWYKYDVTI